MQTDISLFYSSIYTHSVAWALHGKSAAKHNRGLSLLGNQLDKVLRDSQDGQTLGIPIGPDTSLVVAEAVLAAADVTIANELSDMHGFRYMDDYEFVCSSRTEAERVLSILSRILADYELSLNSRKTRIVELPDPTPPWVAELTRFRIRVSSRQRDDIHRFFDMAFNYAKEYPNASVLKFAVGRILLIRMRDENWSLIQYLLLQCALAEPDCIRRVMQVFDLVRRRRNLPIESDALELALNRLIERHAPIGNSGDVAWALWSVIVLGSTVADENVQRLEEMRDPVVSLLTLDADRRGLLNRPLDKRRWRADMTKAALYDERWLLSYEANVKGWLPSVRGDHVASDAAFGYLKANDVYFYDSDRFVPTSTGASPDEPEGRFGLLAPIQENLPITVSEWVDY